MFRHLNYKNTVQYRHNSINSYGSGWNIIRSSFITSEEAALISDSLPYSKIVADIWLLTNVLACNVVKCNLTSIGR